MAQQQLSKWFPFKRGERPATGAGLGAEYPSVIGQSMREAMDRFFRDDWLARPMLLEPTLFGDFSPTKFVPSVDIADEKKELKVTAELPGLERDDVEIDVADNHLVIRGEKKYAAESSEEGFYRTERAYGMFTRSIPLPVDVDVTKADAQMKNGVLTIRLPKAAGGNGRKRIPIHN